MRRLLTVLFLSVIVHNTYSQGLGYSDKKDLGNGLFKVKSGNYYGIIDTNNNVVVSVEYQDIVFREGKALLTKNNILWGIIDSIGNIKKFNGEYKVHPKYGYISEGYIPVTYTWLYDEKWGYINSEGIPYKTTVKIKGARSSGTDKLTLFDDVTPFVNGLACIYVTRGGWKHIDIYGKERFILDNNEFKPIFRSSIYKGECIIASENGIKQYQENNNSAIVKINLSNTSSLIDIIEKGKYTEVIFKEGTVILDSLRRAVKYKNNNDSIVFIELHNKNIINTEKLIIDTLSLRNDLTVKLTAKNLQADSNGKAYTKVTFRNVADMTFENLHVKIIIKETGTVLRDEVFNLDGGENKTLSCTIPAKFSTDYLNRNIVIQISYLNQPDVIYNKSVNIKRYTPIRSR